MGQSSGRLSSGRSISVISGPPAVILHAAVIGASIQFVSASQKHEPVFVIAVRAASAHSSSAQQSAAALQTTLQLPLSLAAPGAPSAAAPSHSAAGAAASTGQPGAGVPSPAASSVPPLSSSHAAPTSALLQPGSAALTASSAGGAAVPPSASMSLMPPLSVPLPSPSAAVLASLLPSSASSSSLSSSTSSAAVSSPFAVVSELSFELVRRYTAFDRLYHSLRALQPVHQQHVSHVPAHPDPNGPTFLADMSLMLSAWMANLLANPTLARQTVTILFFTQQEFNTLPPHSQLQLADKQRLDDSLMDDDEQDDDDDDADAVGEDDEEDGRRQAARSSHDVAETADTLMTDVQAPIRSHRRTHTDGHSHLLDEEGAGEGADVVADISLAQLRAEMGSPTLAPLYERTPSISSTHHYQLTDEQRNDDHTTTQRSHSHSHSSARNHTTHHAAWHTYDASASAAPQPSHQQQWQQSSPAHTAPHHGHLHQLHTTSQYSHHAHLTTRADAGWTPPTLHLSHNNSPPALGLHGALPASSPRSLSSSSSSSASPTLYLPPPNLRPSQEQQHTLQLSPAGSQQRALTASTVPYAGQHYPLQHDSQYQQLYQQHHHHSLYSPQPPHAHALPSDGATELACAPITSPPSSTSSSSQSSESPALLVRDMSSPAAGRHFMSIAPSRSSFSFSPSHSRRSLSYNTAATTSPPTNALQVQGHNQHEHGSISPQQPTPPLPQSTRHSSSSCSPSSRSGSVRLRDFHLLKVIGKGSFGKVLLVRKRDTDAVYAMKVLHKANVIKRNQVEHTMTERSVLEYIRHPFIVALRYAFQTKHKLYFVLDYMPGQSTADTTPLLLVRPIPTYGRTLSLSPHFSFACCLVSAVLGGVLCAMCQAASCSFIWAKLAASLSPVPSSTQLK